MKSIKKSFIVILGVIVMVCSFGLLGCKSVKPEDYYTQEEIAKYSQYIGNTGKKGTVIAYGGGFDQDDNVMYIVNKSIEKSGISNPKVLFMPAGRLDELDMEDAVILGYQKAGCEVSTLQASLATQEEIETKIANSDIIYETGGNLKWLTNLWVEKGMYQLLHDAYDRGAVLVGVSTGAMCWGRMGYDDCEENVFRIVTDFPFLGVEPAYSLYNASDMLPFCICPHYDNVAYRTFTSTARKLELPSLGIENGVAVIYHDGSYETMIDPSTPNRKLYLFYPARGINKLNVTNDTQLVNIVNAEMRMVG